MARRVSIELVDDIDGSNAVETVSFALDGTTYEIDLNKKNGAKLRDALAGFIASGRKVGRARSTAKKASAGGSSAAEVRAWAQSNGYKVPDRGRIPADVREAFDAAN